MIVEGNLIIHNRVVQGRILSQNAIQDIMKLKHTEIIFILLVSGSLHLLRILFQPEIVICIELDLRPC